MSWKPINEADDAVEGVYWVRGTYQQMDGDVTNSGEYVGWYTDKAREFIALAEIEWLDGDGDGEPLPVFTAIDPFHLGIVDEDYHVTHYKEVDFPSFPGETR